MEGTAVTDILPGLRWVNPLLVQTSEVGGHASELDFEAGRHFNSDLGGKTHF